MKCNFGGGRCGTSTIVDIMRLKVNFATVMIFHFHVSLCAGWMAQRHIFIITIFELRIVTCQIRTEIRRIKTY